MLPRTGYSLQSNNYVVRGFITQDGLIVSNTQQYIEVIYKGNGGRGLKENVKSAKLCICTIGESPIDF